MRGNINIENIIGDRKPGPTDDMLVLLASLSEYHMPEWELRPWEKGVAEKMTNNGIVEKALNDEDYWVYHLKG